MCDIKMAEGGGLEIVTKSTDVAVVMVTGWTTFTQRTVAKDVWFRLATPKEWGPRFLPLPGRSGDLPGGLPLWL